MSPCDIFQPTVPWAEAKACTVRMSIYLPIILKGTVYAVQPRLHDSPESKRVHRRDMRRKPGTLLSIEVAILSAGLELTGPGRPGFHGFGIANTIKERAGARLLTAHGTLYKALQRMERAGLLASAWEDPLIAAEQGRPRRRLYQVTGAGEAALARSRISESTRGGVAPDEGLAPA